MALSHPFNIQHFDVLREINKKINKIKHVNKIIMKRSRLSDTLQLGENNLHAFVKLFIILFIQRKFSGYCIIFINSFATWYYLFFKHVKVMEN